MAKVFNLTILSFLICTVLIDVNYADTDKDTDTNNWIHPDAWGLADSITSKFKSVDSSQTNKQLIEIQDNCPVADDRIEFTNQIYLKLVRYIFRKSYMRKIPLSNTYLRSINFHITYEQLERLERTEDIGDIDSIVFDIISQSSANDYTYKLLNWSDEILLYFKEFIEFIKTYQHLAIALLAFIGIIIILKNTRITFGLVLIMLLISFFIWRVKIEHDVCKEEQQTVDFIKFAKSKDFDHCKNLKNENQYMALEWLKGFFKLDTHSKCVQQIMEKNAFTNKCDYSKIIPKVIVQLLFEPGRVIIDEILMLTLNIVDKFKFPYNYIFATIILCSFFYLIKDVLRTTIISLMKNIFQRNRRRRDSGDVTAVACNNQHSIDFAAAVLAKLMSQNQQPIVNVSSQGESVDITPATNENEGNKVIKRITDKANKSEDAGDDILSVSENIVDLK